MTTKNTKKIKVDFIVDLTNVNGAYDAYKKFVGAKFENNVDMKPFEVSIYMYHNINDHSDEIAKQVYETTKYLMPQDLCEDAVEQKTKPNLFKRIWNKLFGRK